MKQLWILLSCSACVCQRALALSPIGKEKLFPLQLCGTAEVEVQKYFCKITERLEDNEAFRMCSGRAVHVMVSEVDLKLPHQLLKPSL